MRESFHLKLGLRGQFVLLFLLVSLIPLLVVSFLARALGANALENTIGESLAQLAKEKLDQADRSISVRLKAIRGEIDTIRDAVDEANNNPDNKVTLLMSHDQLKDNVRQFEAYAGVGSQVIITTSQRLVIQASHNPMHFPQVDGQWWHRAYNNGYGYELIEDVEYDETKKTHRLPIALPIHYQTGDQTKVVGVLRIIMSLPELSLLVQPPLEADEILGDAEVFIITKSGRVIASPGESGYKFLDYIAMSNAAMMVINAQHQYYGYEMEGESESDTQNQKKVYGWARTYNWNTVSWGEEQNFTRWAVLVSKPESVAFREISRLTNKILAFTFVSCVIVIPIAWIVSQRIVTPIMQVAQAARAIGQGEFDQEIPVTSSNEVGMLAEEFNSMRWNLKAAIEKILKEEKKMTAIVNSLTEGLILVDGTGRVLYINPAAESLLHINVNQIGQEFTQVIVNRELKNALNDAQDQMDLNKTVSLEVTLANKNNKLVLRIIASPFLDANGFTLGTVYVFDDITREKEIDQMKSDFVSLVSHELRTPLTSIIGFVSFVLDGKAGPINEKQHNSLIRVQRQSTRLATLINDLLDVSRIESGGIQMRQDPISLIKIAKQRIDDIRPQADEKSIQLKLLAPESLPTTTGDEEQIGRVLTNLIGNAIKFTPVNGSITVKIRMGGNLMHVEVIDTGPGIPAEERQKIFQKFYQLSDVHTRQQGGSGLGLSIAKNIIAAHGGKLWVDEGEGGKGSNFQFILPLSQ